MVRRSPLVTFALLLGLAACAPDGDGGPVVLHSGGDLVAGGRALELPDTLPGDALVGGGEIRFYGSVAGSYLGAGGDQRVGGRVEGGVHIAAGRGTVEGEVGRNVTAVGGELTVEPTALIRRNAYLVGGTVTVRGPVQGHLRVAGGRVEVDAPVGGNLDVVADELVIGPGARITGDVSYRVDPSRVSIDPAAGLGGELEALPPLRRVPPGVGLLFKALRFFAFLLVGIVVVALVPGPVEALAAGLDDRPAGALGWGLLVLLLAPILTAVAAATVVGIPLAMIGVALILLAAYLSPVVPSLWLGRRILDGRPDTGTVMAFLTGGALLGFAMLLPWIGWLARLVITALGAGALALHLSGERGANSD